MKRLTKEKSFSLAIQNHTKRNFKIAKKFYDQTLKLDPNFVDAHNNLGILFHQLGEYQKAINCYEKANQIKPNNSNGYSNLGFTLSQLGKNQKAINCHKKAIQIQPNNISAHNNLGNVFKNLGEHQKAISCYEKAIKIQPNYGVAHFNLGNVFELLGKYQQALNCYEKSIKIDAKNVDAHTNLGNVFKNLGEPQKAIKCYEKAIKIQPNYTKAYNNLASLFKKLGEDEKAINFYEKAIEIDPKQAKVFNNLGNVFRDLGEHKKAINCYEKAIKIEPDNLTSHWLRMNTFPIIYKNLEEIEYYRKNFTNNIKKIKHLLNGQSNYSKKKLVEALNSSTNFYLPYQGKDDLKLQRQYSNLIEKITIKIYQKFHQEKQKNNLPNNIRVGFVSAFFKKHTVSKLFKNWIIKLDKKYFQSLVYYLGNKFDHTTEEIKQGANHFFYHTDVDQLINQISQDKLDVLIYLDIGMRSRIQILSSLRLAPTQCVAWGHPVTSGFKNIDYYLSGESMEDQNTQKYYSENLINLPNLGINYDPPDLGNIKNPKISNKTNATIYLNLQSLFKLLPQDDHIYLDILEKNSNSYFWFIEGRKSSVTTIFKDRISELFQKKGYDFKKYSYFHPRCSQEEYLGLIEESDIILDSLNWSGGNTSLEAISLNKPIVTYPTAFMRGRHTYGILKILDIEETIAISKKNYVDIAVKLANDNNLRNFIISKIKKNKNRLFDDIKPLRFLEDLILKKFI